MTQTERLNIYHRVLVEEFLREWEFLIATLNGRAAPKADFTDKLIGVIEGASSLGLSNVSFPGAGIVDFGTRIILDWANDKRRKGGQDHIAALEYKIDTISLRVMVETAALEASRHYQYALLQELSDDPMEGIIPFAKVGVERMLDYIIRRRLPLTLEHLVEGFIAGHSGAVVKNITNTKLQKRNTSDNNNNSLKERIKEKVGIGGYTAEGIYGRSGLMTTRGELYALSNKKQARHKMLPQALPKGEIFKEEFFNYGYTKLLKGTQDPKYGYMYVPSYWVKNLYGHIPNYEFATKQLRTNLSLDLKTKLTNFMPVIVSIDKVGLENYLKERSRNENLSLITYVRMSQANGQVETVVYEPDNVADRNLTGLDFSGADLSDCCFVGCHFGGSLIKTDFSRGVLRYSDWSEVTSAERVNLSSCQAEFLKANKVNFTRANFTQANLSCAELVDTTLTNIKCLGVNLQETKLGGIKTLEADQLAEIKEKQAQAEKEQKSMNDKLEQQLQLQQEELNELQEKLQGLVAGNIKNEELRGMLENLSQKQQAHLVFERTTKRTLIRLESQQKSLTERQEAQEEQLKKLKLQVEELERGRQEIDEVGKELRQLLLEEMAQLKSKVTDIDAKVEDLSKKFPEIKEDFGNRLQALQSKFEDITRRDYFPSESSIDYTKGPKNGSSDLTSNVLLFKLDSNKIDNTNYVPSSASYTKEPKLQGSEDVLEYDKDREAWLNRAEKDDAIAQFNLGCCYYNGSHGVRQNYHIAMKWYNKAANQGEVESLNTIGNCYEKGGRGVPQDPQKAMEYFRKAAEKGLASAQFNLASCYQKYVNTAEGLKHAVKWYIQAANQGHVEARFYLGLCYEKGYGVAADPKAAMKIYEDLLKEGHKKQVVEDRIKKLTQRTQEETFSSKNKIGSGLK